MILRTLRSLLIAVLISLVGGCSTYFPINEAVSFVDRESGYRSSRRWAPERSNDVLIILAFSGGGTRAAAFAYGVLEELNATGVNIDGREASLLDEVDHITGVSGGCSSRKSSLPPLRS